VPTIAALVTADITPLYYIATGYGATPLATVESEMQDAVNWYGVSNFFFDEESTSDASYYQALYNYAIAVGSSRVVFNPGTMISQSYMSFGADEVQLIFEGTEAGFRTQSFPSWMASYPASEFYAALSAGTSTRMNSDVTDAVNDHIGNIYVDDEAEPPSYSTLPAFWSAEVADVANAP
jgi:Spherulation-specific family 4